MRRQIRRRRHDDLREFGQLGGDRQFARVVEARKIRRSQFGRIAAGFRPGIQHRADAGVGVLDVIDRVLVRLALGQIEIEIEVLVGLRST